jgi:hypothetical protein
MLDAMQLHGYSDGFPIHVRGEKEGVSAKSMFHRSRYNHHPRSQSSCDNFFNHDGLKTINEFHSQTTKNLSPVTTNLPFTSNEGSESKFSKSHSLMSTLPDENKINGNGTSGSYSESYNKGLGDERFYYISPSFLPRQNRPHNFLPTYEGSHGSGGGWHKSYGYNQNRYSNNNQKDLFGSNNFVPNYQSYGSGNGSRASFADHLYNSKYVLQPSQKNSVYQLMPQTIPPSIQDLPSALISPQVFNNAMSAHHHKISEAFDRLLCSFLSVNFLLPPAFNFKKKKGVGGTLQNVVELGNTGDNHDVVNRPSPSSPSSLLMEYTSPQLLCQTIPNDFRLFSSVTPALYTSPHHFYMSTLPLSPLFFINRYFYLFYFSIDDIYKPLHPLPPTIMSSSDTKNYLHNINNYDYSLSILSSIGASISPSFLMPSSPPKLVFTSEDTNPDYEMAMHPWLYKPLGVYVYVLKDVMNLVNANEGNRENKKEKEKRRNGKKLERELVKEKKEIKTKGGKMKEEIVMESVKKNVVEEPLLNICFQIVEKTPGKTNRLVKPTNSSTLDLKEQKISSSHVNSSNNFNISLHYDQLLSCLIFFFFFFFIFIYFT